MKKKPVHYVDNKQLYEDLKAYIIEYDNAVENNLPLPIIPDSLGIAVEKIAKNLGNRHQFRYYSYLDEMVGDGIENVFLYIHKFNYHEYKNPFAYITQIIFFAFLRRIAKEQKQQYIKMKSMRNSFIMSEMATISSADDLHYIENMDMSYFDDEKFSALALKFEPKFHEKIDSEEKEEPKKKGIENFFE